jgi:hypothetical protein
MMSSHYAGLSGIQRETSISDPDDVRPVQAIVESIKIIVERSGNLPGWGIASLSISFDEPIEVRGVALMDSAGRKVPAAVRALYSRLEQAFACFAQVPYHGARTLRELEQMLVDLEDLTGAPGTRRHR